MPRRYQKLVPCFSSNQMSQWLWVSLFSYHYCFLFVCLLPNPFLAGFCLRDCTVLIPQAQLPFLHRPDFSGTVAGHILQLSVCVARRPGSRAEQNQCWLFEQPCWLPLKKTRGKCHDLCPSALQGWTLHRRGLRKHWPCSADGRVLWQPGFKAVSGVPPAPVLHKERTFLAKLCRLPGDDTPVLAAKGARSTWVFQPPGFFQCPQGSHHH